MLVVKSFIVVFKVLCLIAPSPVLANENYPCQCFNPWYVFWLPFIHVHKKYYIQHLYLLPASTYRML